MFFWSRPGSTLTGVAPPCWLGAGEADAAFRDAEGVGLAVDVMTGDCSGWSIGADG